MRKSRSLRVIKLLIIALLAVLLLAPERFATANEESRLQSIVGPREFDYLTWEVNAFSDKGLAVLTAGHTFLDEATRQQVVLNYLDLVHETQAQEALLNRIYSDPEIVDPAVASQEQQQQLAATRAKMAEQQPLAEAIVQQQVGTILAEEGFSLFGETWPPVLMHMTPLPSLLVVSPRDKIESKDQVSLDDGLSVADFEEMETAVFDDLNQSALVVPLGGIGTYPAMIRETNDINWLAEVVAHEWAHHWLTLQPLGMHYAADPATRIINETVASLVDQELGRRMISRYYPELLPPEPAGEPAEEPRTAPEPPEFDFQTELANTRTRTDELLAEGKIEEAEAYMEARRVEFRDHGYQIRKINQAFFAFYGAYAAEPGGAQGTNPIGPMLMDIRAQSGSLHEFLQTVAPITSFADLQDLHEALITPTAGN
jgi:hypothetical protein